MKFNKNKQTINYTIVLLLLVASLAGCNKYLTGQAYSRNYQTTDEEQEHITKSLLTSTKYASISKEQNVRVLRVAPTAIYKDYAKKPVRRTASIIIFNYDTGRAMRILYDPSTNIILREDLLSGRPQASKEEIKDAVDIINSDPKNAVLLSSGSEISGGFIVDGPPQMPAHHRFIQMKIVNSDHSTVQRLLIVDLTVRTIALSRDF